MQIWFWAWLLLAAIFGVLGVFDRDHTLPWALGAIAAALLEALHAPIAWEWAAFFGLPSAVIVAAARFKAPGRRSARKAGRTRDAA